MSEMPLRLPSLDDFSRTMNSIVAEFQPKTCLYLASNGEWREDPVTLLQRTNNELLFQIWMLSAEERADFFKILWTHASDEDVWLTINKINSLIKAKHFPEKNVAAENVIANTIIQPSLPVRQTKKHPCQIVIDVLSWVLHYEALRITAESFVPEWQTEAKVHKQAAKTELSECLKVLERLGHSEKNKSLPDSLERITALGFKFLEDIPLLKAEEDKLLRVIQLLLEKAPESQDPDDLAYMLISEKIHPPGGIVTETSPSFLQPCLTLLTNKTIPISSGIQYKASVILSILQDPRSVKTLIQAMEDIPPRYTKIRENIIYSLGSLRESTAVESITHVLKEPDRLRYTDEKGEEFSCVLLEQKEEALWALGKIGADSLRCLPELEEYTHHPSAKIKTYLARAMGEIGKAQRERKGGVSVEILIILLRLMQAKNRQVFEETVSALRKIDMPSFIHTLYLYSAGAVSILGLKPAQRGLYELSETLHYLLNVKKRVIMAVNGDSGTGKTYFCQSILSGFGDLREKDILYLMRDRKRDQKIFNQMLGLTWLRKYIEPGFYQDYPHSEDRDDPEEFLTRFLEQHRDKKLIILDGCRDQSYFQRVIELFHFRGELDVEVNFRATLSTRRLNLEDREVALESVRTHLDFLEEPALEDTLLYQEGVVILYDLDNSIPSRLNRQEIKELFQKRRIESWGDLVKIGDFKPSPKSFAITSQALLNEQKNFSSKEEKWPVEEHEVFQPDERIYNSDLNEDLTSQPNLLQTIPMSDIAPEQIAFYAQDQIVGMGQKGCVFVLTFLDSRIFYTFTEEFEDMCLLGRDIFLIDQKGNILSCSFERNEIIRFGSMDSSALDIKALARDKIITGHADGKIRVWDFSNRTIHAWPGHKHPIISLASDYQGRVYSSSWDGSIKQWDIGKGRVNIASGIEENFCQLSLYPKGQILAVSCRKRENDSKALHPSNSIRIFDLKNGQCRRMETFSGRQISSISVYYDGRIIATFSESNKKSDNKQGNLIIIDPKNDKAEYTVLNGHTGTTKDSLATGPRIITCGSERDHKHSLKIWGTEFYVKMELSKLALQA